MENRRHPRQILVNSEKPARYQLHRSYTLDFWNVEIDINGKDSDDKLNIEPKKVNRINFQQSRLHSSNKLKKIVETEEELNLKYVWLFFIISIVLSTTIVCLTIAVKMSKETNNICTSLGCIMSAATVLENINENIDPCHDFYDFACGNYGKELNRTVSENANSKGNIIVKNQMNLFFNELLPSNATKLFKYLKTLYSICGNSKESSLEKELEFLKSLFDSLGGWPMFVGEKWNEQKFNWINLTYDLRRLGFPYMQILQFQVREDINNSTENSLYVFPASLNDNPMLPRLAVELVKLLKTNKVDIQKDMDDLINWKNSLNKVMEEKKSQESRLTLKQLQAYYSNINWMTHLTHIINIPQVKFTEDTVIQVETRSFVVLDTVLKTPKRILSNYIFSDIVLYSIYKLPKIYNRLVYSNLDNFQIASESLWLPMNSWYVRKYLKRETKEGVAKVVDFIKKELKNIFKNSNFFDKDTQDFASMKLDALEAIVGYPEELINDTILEYYYDKLEINFNTCLQAVNSISKLEQDKMYEKLMKSNYNDWLKLSTNITQFKAFYDKSGNRIIIPAAYLLNTVYDTQRPQYVNYAALGSTIGHEITHGFDETGRYYGVNGNIKNWWSPATEEAYQERTHCLVQQYQNFTIFNMTVNGNITLSENIADNEGLKQAYAAYQTFMKSSSKEKNMPGLPYTQKQMFWISYAQIRCEKLTESYAENQILFGRNAPNKFRVIGTISNLKSFSKDFDCPLGAPMNPRNKCNVW